MRWTDDRAGTELLNSDECLDLLHTQVVGRLAVVADHEPHIFPVNYVMDGQIVAIRTAEGMKLDHSVRSTRVAFEIDGYDEATRSGWSVVVRGRAEEVLRAADRQRLAALDLRPWAAGDKDNWLIVRPERISGRRIAPQSS
jgi:nitroimidazol reductase NimA-like FMN-containing flavoprotein (pyridoxamine 5'-phosphate oxidase superfamily)